MSWKFWKSEHRSDSAAPAWPANIQEALRQLLTFYTASDAAPFSQWAAPGVTFGSTIEPTARQGARGYQLALWFWLFAEKHGAIAAKMARDAFCALANQTSAGLGDSTEKLVDLENRLAHLFEGISAEQRTFAGEHLSVELPMEYFLAAGFLKEAPESPFAGQDKPDFQGEDLKLAACFRHAAEQALCAFRLTIDSVEFDASLLDSWQWSATPGAVERHLQRRYRNPLFPLHRQMVTGKDVYDARVADNLALSEIRKDLNELAREFYATAQLPLNWQSFLDGLRERLDKLEDRRVIAGGPHAGLGEAIAELRNNLLHSWRGAIQKNRKSLADLEQVEATQAQRRTALYASDWIAQLLSHASVMPTEEVVPSLLSESPDALERAVTSLQAEPRLHETLAHCRVAARRLVEDVRTAGHPVPEVDEKLRILDGTPGQVPA